MFTNTTPRPYIITFQLQNGETLPVNVVAFDLGEAMLAANISLSARGFTGLKLLDASPDVAKIQANSKQEASDAATQFVTSLFKKHSKP